MPTLKDTDKLIELIDDDIAALNKDMPREGHDVCLCTLNMVKQYIKGLPTAEPKHGQILNTGGYVCGETEWACSLCDYTEWRTGKPNWHYCPNCGARMDEPAPEAAEIINDGTYSAGEED